MSREKKKLKKKAEMELVRKEKRRDKHKEKQRKLEIKNSIKDNMKRRMHLQAMVLSAKELDEKNGNTPTKIKVPLSQIDIWESLVQNDGLIFGLELSQWDVDDKEIIEKENVDINNDIMVI